MDGIRHCISIREPNVALITARAKTIEYRSRRLITRTPETIAIATSKRGAGIYLPGGYIVGVARITAIVPWDNGNDGFWERAVMNRAAGDMDGGYAMMIGGFAACRPVPVRGNVGLYAVPDGFAPEYGETADDLHDWWRGAEVWDTGPTNGDEAALMELMSAWGLGWRIDD